MMMNDFGDMFSNVIVDRCMAVTRRLMYNGLRRRGMEWRGADGMIYLVRIFSKASSRWLRIISRSSWRVVSYETACWFYWSGRGNG